MDPIFAVHRGGKLSVEATVAFDTREDLALAYTPGVVRVCQAIAADPALAHEYTWVGNTVAVVSDGTAVVGLGDIGPRAAMPVMEGKAALLKKFAGVNAVPICLDTTEPDEIVAIVKALGPSFGGINLEDISAPRCFDIERRLEEAMDIPVFHNDQHGTAIAVAAVLLNSATLLGRDLHDLKIVTVGAGAAGIAITKMLLTLGVGDIIVLDSRGIIDATRGGEKAIVAARTNRSGRTGGIRQALTGADVLIGVSGARIAEQDVALMAPGGAIFALSNPTLEVDPEVAGRYAAVVATGRSDLPNQINNSLAFPGIFRGALDARASRITDAMKLAAAGAIAALVADELRPDYIVPSLLDPRVVPAVAAAVAAAAE